MLKTCEKDNFVFVCLPLKIRHICKSRFNGKTIKHDHEYNASDSRTHFTRKS